MKTQIVPDEPMQPSACLSCSGCGEHPQMLTDSACLWTGIAHLWERHPAFFLRSFRTCLERKPWATWFDPTVGPAWGRGLDCSALEGSSNVDNPIILWTAGQYFLGKKLYSRVWESALYLIQCGWCLFLMYHIGSSIFAHMHILLHLFGSIMQCLTDTSVWQHLYKVLVGLLADLHSESASAVSITSILQLVASMEKAERAEYFLQVSHLQMYSLRFSLSSQFRSEKAMCILWIFFILSFSFALWLAFDFHEGWYSCFQYREGCEAVGSFPFTDSILTSTFAYSSNFHCVFGENCKFCI